jgi:hypothetical protein
MLDRAVLASEAGLIIVDSFMICQAAQNVVNYFLVGVELGDMPTDVLLLPIAEQIQFRLIGPQDSAVWPYPVQPHCRILDEVGKPLPGALRLSQCADVP